MHYLSHLPRFSETLNAYKLRNYQAEGLIGQVSKLYKKCLVGDWVQPGLQWPARADPIGPRARIPSCMEPRPAGAPA